VLVSTGKEPWKVPVAGCGIVDWLAPGVWAKIAGIASPAIRRTAYIMIFIAVPPNLIITPRAILYACVLRRCI
jgi:hypothetical protein